MLYKRLGNSGVKVSNVCLGTMTFGSSERPGNCNEESSHAILNRYVELGGNFIDTANIYSNNSESERFIGSWLTKIGEKRHELVIATKARLGNGREGPINGACLSRKHLVSEVEQSLKRLQTDYIDLYQWHCWDKTTPLEESLRTMDDLIRAGKIRYFGVSNFCGSQLQKLADLSKQMGLSPCISLQQQYSLLNRELELDLAEVCMNEGIGVLPWSPLKGGWLTGKYERSQTAPPEGTRVHYSTVKNMGHLQSHPNWDMYSKDDQVWDLLDLLKTTASHHDKSVSQVALRWCLQKPSITSVIMGCKTIAQLEDNMAAGSDWELTSEEMAALDAASQPVIPYPYSMINRCNNRFDTFLK